MVFYIINVVKEHYTLLNRLSAFSKIHHICNLSRAYNKGLFLHAILVRVIVSWNIRHYNLDSLLTGGSIQLIAFEFLALFNLLFDPLEDRMVFSPGQTLYILLISFNSTGRNFNNTLILAKIESPLLPKCNKIHKLKFLQEFTLTICQIAVLVSLEVRLLRIPS